MTVCPRPDKPLLPITSPVSSGDGDAPVDPREIAAAANLSFVDVDAIAGPVAIGTETLLHDRKHRVLVVAMQPSFVLRLSVVKYQQLLTIAPSISHGTPALADCSHAN